MIQSTLNLCVLLVLLLSIKHRSTDLGLLGGSIGLAILVRLLGSLSERLVTSVPRRSSRLLGVGADRLVNLGQHILDTLTVDIGSQVLGEVGLVFLLIIIQHLDHVLRDVLAHDAGNVALSIERLSILRVTGESLVVVGDVKATVAGTLQGTENTGTGGGILNSNIQESTERASLLINLLHVEGASSLLVLASGNIASNLLNTRVHLIHTKLLQQAAGQEKAGAVGSRVVLVTSGKAVLGKLLGVSRAQDNVSTDLGRDDLAQHILVAESDAESVLRGLVLVLVLGDEFVALTVVSLALSPSAELGLEALEVLLVLNHLNERHFRYVIYTNLL
mmetsp:Transcript_100517/g.216881  ORF Transcript_100517/g.216881 Transcript_100517/m.216881 type:complete len:333 (+) Transcript_100517:62-1060(+)